MQLPRERAPVWRRWRRAWKVGAKSNCVRSSVGGAALFDYFAVSSFYFFLFSIFSFFWGAVSERELLNYLSAFCEFFFFWFRGLFWRIGELFWFCCYCLSVKVTYLFEKEDSILLLLFCLFFIGLQFGLENLEIVLVLLC